MNILYVSIHMTHVYIVLLCHHPYLIVWVAQLCESIHVQQAGVAQLAVGVHHLLTLNTQEHTTHSFTSYTIIHML